ncbi:50S ribosomal protein L12 [Plasmodium brasilianum]|uniref:50S ribosomal protein L12, apicoplast, putative n=2 Tax=Plasmodium (Plasmodium) TaxID=418103 RepID=A0A1A8W096_PLAMA|nr:50S ribosomal protein L12, apicoplast, putative [Plasmodium malariae]KAI4837737.1 50S ribosomal protein L12 [Plasmodium brasilianum]SBS86183.1 50S ribosomal protein L12, apicoplast, putative [Plasmodium malariae]SCN44698.1 50S ribosomal protein L12, apicoplast, putative [Plasmodium malariae]
MKCKRRVLSNLTRKKKVENLCGQKKKRSKLLSVGLFKIFSKPIFRLLLIIYILLLHLVDVVKSFKLSNEQNKFNCNNFLYYENKSNDNYGRKNFLNYKSRPVLKKDIIINSNKIFKLKSEKVDKIIDSLKELTLLEASELVKKIELTFSVDARQNLDSSKGTQENKTNESETNAKEEEEDDENKVYDLILENIEPNKKIPIIKIVKEIKKDLNLKQAKDIVDNLPQTLFEKINKETADKWKTKLTDAGGVVKLK